MFHHHTSCFRVSFLCVAVVATAVTAQDKAPANLVKPYLTQFRPLPQGHLRATRIRAAQRLDKLNQLLDSAGAARAKEWRTYLQWGRLRQQMQAAVPDRNALERVARRFRTGYRRGFDHPTYLAASRAVSDVLDALELDKVRDLKAVYRAKLNLLGADMSRYDKSRSDVDAVQISQTLRWLKKARQSPALVAAVRARYGGSNMQVTATQEAFSYALSRSIQQDSQISDYLFRTDIQGMAKMRGSLSGQLRPSKNGVRFDLLMKGKVDAKTIGVRRSVTVHMETTTSISAKKTLSLAFDQSGVKSEPATAQASTATRSAKVAAKSPFVERLAIRSVNKKQSETEAAASRRAEEQIAAELDRQVAEQFNSLGGEFDISVRQPAKRIGLFPSRIRSRSTAKQLDIAALLASDMQLGAPTPPPTITGKNAVVWRFHESMANNALETFLGGAEVTDRNFQKFLRTIVGPVPREYRLGTHLKRWSVTLAKVRPFRFSFNNQVARVSLYLTSIKRDNVRHNLSMEVSAQYRAHISKRFGLSLMRSGDVSYQTKGSQPAGHQAIHRFIKRKMDALLGKEMFFEGLVIPPGGTWDLLTAFELQQIQFQQGWAIGGIGLSKKKEKR